MVDDLSWCILRTEPRREFMAENALRGHRVEVALPYWFDCIHRRGRQVRVRKALFPGYLFAKLPTSGGAIWDRVRTVGGLMQINPSPAMRADYEIVKMERYSLFRPGSNKKGLGEEVERDVKAIMDFAEAMRDPKPEVRKFALGQLVKVIGGPFEGRFGDITRLDDGERVQMLLEWLGRKVPVSVAENDVEAA